MDLAKYREQLRQLSKSLTELRESGLERRTNADGSYVWEDCEPLAENFLSAGRTAPPATETQPLQAA